MHALSMIDGLHYASQNLRQVRDGNRLKACDLASRLAFCRRKHIHFFVQKWEKNMLCSLMRKQK